MRKPQKDGRLITADYVLLKPAPDGAGEHNRCYQTPPLFLFFGYQRAAVYLNERVSYGVALASGSCLIPLC